jgi:hypothetical protein
MGGGVTESESSHFYSFGDEYNEKGQQACAATLARARAIYSKPYALIINTCPDAY